MNLLFWLLSAVIILLLIASILAYPVVKRQRQKVKSDPGQFGLEYQEVSFTTADNILLKGWWIPAARSEKAIIFLHGYAGSCDPDLKYAPAFHDKGYNLLLFDFRAHGRSQGWLTSMGALELLDCRAAIRFAEEQTCNRIGLLGFSMGGRVAILTAAVDKKSIRAIISDGGPARLTTAIASDLHQKGVAGFLTLPIATIIVLGMCLWTGKNLFIDEPYFKAKKLNPLPVLFIHGDQDPHTRSDELEKMASEAGQHAETWRIPEAGHRNAEDFIGVKYLERVISFFESNL
jgi:uncharacterized protein